MPVSNLNKCFSVELMLYRCCQSSAEEELLLWCFVLPQRASGLKQGDRPEWLLSEKLRLALVG